MDKKLISKIVAAIDLVMGVFYLFTPLVFPIFTLPKVTQMYTDFNINRPSFTFTYIVLGIIMLMGIINLFIGLKILKNKDRADKYLKYGIISAVVAFFLGGFLTAVAILPVTSSIYNITSQF